jgi:hypothetical protein
MGFSNVPTKPPNVPSTLGWVAFFDILLKALNVVQVKYPFYIRHSGSMLLP